MEFKGTKGDWYLRHQYVTSKNEDICKVFCWDDVDERDEDTTAEQARLIFKANAQLIAHSKEMLEAMQEFCDRVDKGEVRSSKTYAKFKSIIHKATTI